MKTRIITGVLLLAVIVPLIAIDHIVAEVGFLILGILLSIMAAFEMMNMFYIKSPSLHTLRYVIPVFSAVLTYTVVFSATRGLDIGNETYETFIYHFLVMVAFI